MMQPSALPLSPPRLRMHTKLKRHVRGAAWSELFEEDTLRRRDKCGERIRQVDSDVLNY
jgi:hypothetical protein